MQEKITAFLYETKIGRILLGILVRPTVSKFAGKLLDLRVSVILIPGFIRRNHIDMTQFERKRYRSYNDFFTRKIKKEARPFDLNAKSLIAPCDARLTACEISPKAKFLIKGKEYTLNELLRNEKAAKYYEGGYLLIFRLCVDDYHRYCYPDSGYKSKNIHIPGVFHTVQPIACEHVKIYKENTREYTLIKSDNFKTILMMEVGALLVGRIKNKDQACFVKRSEEKGMFEFGGSTIVMCLKKGTVDISRDILENSEKEIETVVKMGRKIGQKSKGE